MGLGKSRRVALAALFGVLIFISKILVPTPIDKAVVVFQALFLALSFLLLGFLGATLVALVGGLLTAIWRAPFAPVTLTFALLYGLLVDVFMLAFKVKAASGDVRTGRLMVALSLSTAVVGLTSYYVTVYILTLLPRNPMLEISILVAGTISGAVAGYLAATIWRKALQHITGTQALVKD